MCVCVCACACAHVCVCVCVCICAFVHAQKRLANKASWFRQQTLTFLAAFWEWSLVAPRSMKRTHKCLPNDLCDKGVFWVITPTSCAGIVDVEVPSVLFQFYSIERRCLFFPSHRPEVPKCLTSSTPSLNSDVLAWRWCIIMIEMPGSTCTSMV